MRHAFAAKENRALLVIAPLLAIIVNRQTWSVDYAKAVRQSDEARVFFDLGDNDLLAHPLIPPAAILSSSSRSCCSSVMCSPSSAGGGPSVMPA